MVKGIAVAEVRHSSITFSLWLGDVSVQSKTTTLDVDTSHLKIIFYSALPLLPPPFYCPPFFPRS